MYTYLLVLLLAASQSSAQPAKCDQTPPHATVPFPSEDNGNFLLSIAHAPSVKEGDATKKYTPDQTYVLTLSAANATKPFRWFMITAEDPDVDNRIYNFHHKTVDVGSLKTLESGELTVSRYSERCANSVENYDNSDKTRVEIHWVSPKHTDKVRIRAMVAENNEVWYTGENLTIILEKDQNPSDDTPPYLPRAYCPLCSEARYEFGYHLTNGTTEPDTDPRVSDIPADVSFNAAVVIHQITFHGQWSRLAHPRWYPSKPDENGYSHLVGATHDFNFTLWQASSKATPGLKLLAEEANSSVIEREIINSMSEFGGTRTLIRGKRRHHPHMSEPSHSLFRVDYIHHLFSVVIALKPSPDWFLGTSKFELCTPDGWLKSYFLPLYPWDAGTMDGVSYESPKSMTQPVNNIERVEVGSFNTESPFYQMNLNDLKPFAILALKRLDVYEWDPNDCAPAPEEIPRDEPLAPWAAESRSYANPTCFPSEWGEWSPCVPDVGSCGIGAQTRSKIQSKPNYMQEQSSRGSCEENKHDSTELKHCFVEC